MCREEIDAEMKILIRLKTLNRFVNLEVKTFRNYGTKKMVILSPTKLCVIKKKIQL